jgi:hypothetical protein
MHHGGILDPVEEGLRAEDRLLRRRFTRTQDELDEGQTLLRAGLALERPGAVLAAAALDTWISGRRAGVAVGR